MRRPGIARHRFLWMATLGLGLASSPSSPCQSAGTFVRGDATQDGRTDLTDPVAILGYLFGGSAAPACLEAADADDTGRLDLTDATYLLAFLFLGGSAIPAPHPDCGPDPTPDGLGCAGFGPCSSHVVNVLGRIVDDAGTPLEGVFVQVNETSVQSEAGGYFQVNGLELGDRTSVSVFAYTGVLQGTKRIEVGPGDSFVDAGDLVLLPLPPPPPPPGECTDVVGRAALRDCGRIFAWGDEHVLYDEYLPGSEAFWTRTLDWLSENPCGASDASRVGCYGFQPQPGFSALLASRGMEVVPLDPPASLEGIGILLVEALPGRPAIEGLGEWVRAGGALMTLVAGLGKEAFSECEEANRFTAPLGLAYDCGHAPPWGPVQGVTDHPLAVGLDPASIPFVNGRWVYDLVDSTSEEVATAGPCDPTPVPDCRKPFPEGGPNDVPVESDCIDLYQATWDPSGPVELHLFGAYESGGGDGGDIAVTVERPGRSVLVLSAYSSVRWVVTAAAGAAIERVLVSSYEPASVEAPPGTDVETTNFQAFGYGSDCGGGQTTALVSAAEGATGLSARSFQGCYRAGSFVIR